MGRYIFVMYWLQFQPKGCIEGSASESETWETNVPVVI